MSRTSARTRAIEDDTREIRFVRDRVDRRDEGIAQQLVPTRDEDDIVGHRADGQGLRAAVEGRGIDDDDVETAPRLIEEGPQFLVGACGGIEGAPSHRQDRIAHLRQHRLVGRHVARQDFAEPRHAERIEAGGETAPRLVGIDQQDPTAHRARRRGQAEGEAGAALAPAERCHQHDAPLSVRCHRRQRVGDPIDAVGERRVRVLLVMRQAIDPAVARCRDIGHAPQDEGVGARRRRADVAPAKHIHPGCDPEAHRRARHGGDGQDDLGLRRGRGRRLQRGRDQARVRLLEGRLFLRELSAVEEVLEESLVGEIGALEFAQLHADVVVATRDVRQAGDGFTQGVLARLRHLGIVLQRADEALHLRPHRAIEARALRVDLRDRRVGRPIHRRQIRLAPREIGLLRA